MENTLKNGLDILLGKSVAITYEGFVKAEYGIEKMKYIIENDILTITGEENNNYLQINLNQIYNFNIEKDKIILNLDNDLNIIINIDR